MLTNRILNHYLKRINLLENHLKIYLPFLNNRDVLEFGCNGAENACLLSEYGANLYLVEPHKKMHKVIINNFKKIKKKINLNFYRMILSKILEQKKIRYNYCRRFFKYIKKKKFIF